VKLERFVDAGLLNAEQRGRIAAALAPLFDRASLPEVRWAAQGR